ncbi:MAG TPA: hemopexin repeat-containing protein [Ktedonobacteraceae bacterium]|nr:hemopexin repeat-containing protein [Ktedonobacteraceae bacterium]
MALIDAAVVWPNGKIYFFSGSDYYRYDIASESVEPNYPRPIFGNWPGLEAPIQGAIVWPELVGGRQKAYLFSRDRFYSYDVANDQVDPGSPMPINLTWIGVLGGSQQDHHIDVALQWPNGEVYLFQEDRYYRITDLTNKKVDPNYPQPIQGNWQGLGTTGQPFTAAFVWPKVVNGQQKAYFFQRSIYFRYDIANDKVDDNYPQPIQGNWQGL